LRPANVCYHVPLDVRLMETAGDRRSPRFSAEMRATKTLPAFLRFSANLLDLVEACSVLIVASRIIDGENGARENVGPVL